MRALLSQTISAARPLETGTWLPGFAHVAAALMTLPVFGAAACATGLVLTSLISFVVWMPLTAIALNGGAALAEDEAAPVLTPTARIVLFVLWTATAWGVASIAR